jgi:hypothetical protein
MSDSAYDPPTLEDFVKVFIIVMVAILAFRHCT